MIPPAGESVGLRGYAVSTQASECVWGGGGVRVREWMGESALETAGRPPGWSSFGLRFWKKSISDTTSFLPLGMQ